MKHRNTLLAILAMVVALCPDTTWGQTAAQGSTSAGRITPATTLEPAPSGSSAYAPGYQGTPAYRPVVQPGVQQAVTTIRYAYYYPAYTPYAPYPPYYPYYGYPGYYYPGYAYPPGWVGGWPWGWYGPGPGRRYWRPRGGYHHYRGGPPRGPGRPGGGPPRGPGRPGGRR